MAEGVEELYERTHADLIIVTVSEISTRAICEQCFGFPSAVLMEKPPGIDLVEAGPSKLRRKEWGEPHSSR